MDVFMFVKSSTIKYDYIFAGPPYDLPTLDSIPDLIFEYDLLAEDGIFVIEHNPHNEFIEHPRLYDVRNYGKSVFSFFK